MCALFRIASSGGKDNSSGGPVPLSRIACHSTRRNEARGVATKPEQRPDPMWRNFGYACLFASPTHDRPRLGAEPQHSARAHTGRKLLTAQIPRGSALDGPRRCTLPPGLPPWWPCSLNGRYQLACNRLTRVQRLLARNPAPLQSSTCFSIHRPRWNIRYYNQDPRRGALRPGSRQGRRRRPPMSSYTSMPCPNCCRGGGML